MTDVTESVTPVPVEFQSGGMFVVERKMTIDMGHRVPDHNSKCRNPHGHRYVIVVGVMGELQPSGSSKGMVMDFGDIAAIMKGEIDDVYDHSFTISDQDEELGRAFDMVYYVDGELQWEDSNEAGWNVNVVPFSPTAEELARHWYHILEKSLGGLAYVKVWETQNSMAVYPMQMVGMVQNNA
jgi:6-pyruvoyltetrahydropterin/6-carboxytetrahydropterin synthase